ncbi:MAG: UbiH/UbiF family hydroxylase, partial [Pseudomonadota bacterium]
AGHRFPPIGAQGLNLGFRDVAVLRRLLTIARQRGNLKSTATEYDRRRQVDVNARTFGVDVLNRSLLADFAPVSAARAVAVAAARNIAPLRRVMMRAGLG